MKLTIEISLDNAAFQDNGLAEEIKIILDKAVNLIENGFLEGKLRDTNGNRVGQFMVTMGQRSSQLERVENRTDQFIIDDPDSHV
jgi:hypothetical protein